MKENRKFAKLLFTILTICFIAFIFSNSLFSGTESGKQSSFVLKLVNQFFAHIGITATVTEHFIRKLGHFTEYFMLGSLLTLTVRMYARKPLKHIFTELFILSIVPEIDECIQSFTPGRGPSVIDVMIDFSGGLTGLMVLLLIINLIDSIRTGKKEDPVA
jgi:VanZ family protein